jgi:hypothetical protein
MKTKTYTNEEIIAYLLGSLPEAETENFDELSFTDEDFVIELETTEKDLVDAYVNGELEGEKLKRFKSFYLASPLRREKVEFAKAFQSFAEKKIAEKPALTEEKTEKTKRGFFSNLFSIPKLSLQWGFALAALALLIFGGWLYFENSRLRNEMSQTQTNREELLKRESELQKREKQLQDEIADHQIKNSETEKELAKIQAERAKLEEELKNRKSPEQQQRPKEQIAETRKQPKTPPNRQVNIASFILTPSLRGTNQLQTVAIPAGTESVEMRLELESDDFSNYRVALQNQADGQTLWQSGKIKSKTSGTNKFLYARFPANLLRSQIYTLQVSGINSNGISEIISDYSFRIVR